jgi:hypothetical protein
MKLRLAVKNGTLSSLYAAEVTRRIRTRYSVSDELAILRKRDTSPEEFSAFNAFAEACKEEARAALAAALEEEVTV